MPLYNMAYKQENYVMLLKVNFPLGEIHSVMLL